MRAALLILLTSEEGLKLSEALSLNIQDVRGRLVLIKKGKDSRLVSFSSRTQQASQTYLGVSPFALEEEWTTVFGWPLLFNLKGERLTSQVAQLAIATLRDSLGLNSNATSRSLRHGRVIELRAQGYNDVTIMEELGFRSRGHLQNLLREIPPNFAAVELATADLGQQQKCRSVCWQPVSSRQVRNFEFELVLSAFVATALQCNLIRLPPR